MRDFDGGEKREEVVISGAFFNHHRVRVGVDDLSSEGSPGQVWALRDVENILWWRAMHNTTIYRPETT